MCELLYVKFVSVKLLVGVVCGGGVRRGGGRRRRAGEGARDTESKTRTPHKVVGENICQGYVNYTNVCHVMSTSQNIPKGGDL